MYYLVQLAFINTDLPFKSSILKLILAHDFVFTDGFLPFNGVPHILFAGVQNVFKKNSNFIRTIIITKNDFPVGGFINYSICRK